MDEPKKASTFCAILIPRIKKIYKVVIENIKRLTNVLTINSPTLANKSLILHQLHSNAKQGFNCSLNVSSVLKITIYSAIRRNVRSSSDVCEFVYASFLRSFEANTGHPTPKSYVPHMTTDLIDTGQTDVLVGR